MRVVKQRDNSQELALRSLLHRMGLRFRTHEVVIRGLRRAPDIIFVRARIAVFVDGCFWHCCPKHGTWPKANRKWWQTKLALNVTRDRDTDARLRSVGWTSIRIWEHEDARRAAAKIANLVRQKLPTINCSNSRQVGFKVR
jgi:DNA mismatch endonuclease (patch repair protein)